MALKAILALVFVVTIMAASIAEARGVVGVVHVNGTLYCTSNGSSGGNGHTTPVFPNAAVQVACPVDVVGYAQANVTTNSNGIYLVVLIPHRNATVNSIVSNCRVFVPTPLSNCNPTLPSAGLVSNLQFVKTVQNGFWPLTYMVAASFTLQT